MTSGAPSSVAPRKSNRGWAIGLWVGLLVAPLLAVAAAGTYALWETGRWWAIWWVFPACWGTAWIVGRWLRPSASSSQTVSISSTAWTPQDHAAARLVEACQRTVGEATPEQLTSIRFYETISQQLAQDLAKHYSPQATDPLAELSIIEVLTVVQLAAEDLEVWARENLPGSHLVTIKQWKMLGKLPAAWKRLSQVWWLASIALNPANIGKYVLSKIAIDPLSKDLQANFLIAFASLFIRQLGFYLIEMHSGRLRAGGAAYRAWARQSKPQRQSSEEIENAPESDLLPAVSLVVVGQAKAGKSSLINALLQEQRANVDVVPCTNDVTQYSLQLSDTTEPLRISDTPGYGDEGLTPQQREAITQAACVADAILLVLKANAPARQSDLALLTLLDQFFSQNRHLKPPPILGVLTHIDLLSPSLEWAPPYHWQQPESRKESSIAAAIQYQRDIFPDSLKTVVPVCTDGQSGRAWGTEEFVIPCLLASLDEAHGCSIVRNLRSASDRNRWRQLAPQLVGLGRTLLTLWKRS